MPVYRLIIIFIYKNNNLDKALNLNTALPERSWDTLSPLPRSLDS